MSIINQMLNDLEKRTHTSANSNLAVPVMLMTRIRSDQKSLKKIYGAIGIIILFACIIGYTMIHTNQVTNTNTVVTRFFQPIIPPINTAENYPAITPLHVTPTIMTAITLQLDKEVTSLRLLLSQDALYQVMTNDKNQLIIVLENSRLVTSIPPINTMNSAVNDIQMINQRNGNLKIILTLKPNSELSHLDLNTSSKLPELQVDFVTTNSDSAQVPIADKIDVITQKNNVGSIIKLRTDISLSDQYQQALRLSSEGHHEEAIQLLTFILIKNPDYSLARESLASLLIAQGRTNQAEKIISVGLQQRPFYPAYIKLKARILVNSGKINQALAQLQLAPPAITSDPEYYAYIAALYQRQNRYELSERLYEQLLALQPNNATWWMGEGIALENVGKPSLAMNAYIRAARSEGLNPELRIYAESRVRHLQS